MWFRFAEETNEEFREREILSSRRQRRKIWIQQSIPFCFRISRVAVWGTAEIQIPNENGQRFLTVSPATYPRRHLSQRAPKSSSPRTSTRHSVYIQDVSFRVVANSLRRRNIFLPTEAKEDFRLSHEYNLRVLSREPNSRRKTLRAVCARCIFLYRLIRRAKAKNREARLVCPSRVVFAKFTIKVVGRSRFTSETFLAQFPATSSQEVFRKFFWNASCTDSSDRFYFRLLPLHLVAENKIFLSQLFRAHNYLFD